MGQSSAAAQSAQREVNRLFRLDRLTAWNTLRATFGAWHDRVIAILMLLAAFAVAHSWFADRPWTIAAWAAFAASTMIGIGAGRLVRTRLSFHVLDGLLAADALHPQTRRRYVATWHILGLALLALVTLIVRPLLLVVVVPAYLAGVLVAGSTDGFRMPNVVGTTRPGWTIRAWLHRPIAGVAAAAILLLSLLPAHTLNTNALMAVAGIETILLTLALTIVDDSIVRFMTIAGYGSQRIIVHYAKGLASFLAVAVPGCWVILGPVAGGIVAGASVAMLLLLTLRILAYRLHGKRFGDLLVSILAGLLVLVAYSMPAALPVIAFAMLWQLQSRGRAKTWLLV